MGIFRYKTKVSADHIGSANFVGEGFSLRTVAQFSIYSIKPRIDFYNGATKLAQFHGVGDQTNKSVKPIGLTFDALDGTDVTHGVATWPPFLDSVVVKRASDNAPRVIIKEASLVDTQAANFECFENGGSITRFVVYLNLRDADGSGGTAGVAFVEGEEYIVEVTGDFTHAEIVYPWPLWLASNNNYIAGHMFTALETGSQPKIYVLAADAPSGQATFDAFVTNNAAAFTANKEVKAMGGQVFTVETNFNNPTTDPLQFKGTQDADNDFTILLDEPQIYLDTTAATNGTGRSRIDPYNTLPALDDNTSVLVLSGSTVGSDTLTSDAIFTVQNGVVGGGGGGTGEAGVIGKLIGNPII